MGRIRSSLVKRTARKLLESYPDVFTGDFNHNKAVVSTLVETRSKKLRNQIAGYVTRVVNATLKRQAPKEETGIEEL